MAAQAYIYGYPLLAVQRVQALLGPLNTLNLNTSFANPTPNRSGKRSVAERTRTSTCSTHWPLDLRDGPVVLTIPDMGERYYSFQLTDPYINVDNYISSNPTEANPVGARALPATPSPGSAIRSLSQGQKLSRRLSQRVVARTRRGHTGRPAAGGRSDDSVDTHSDRVDLGEQRRYPVGLPVSNRCPQRHQHSDHPKPAVSAWSRMPRNWRSWRGSVSARTRTTRRQPSRSPTDSARCRSWRRRPRSS